MKELFINKARCCAVTGHRALNKNFNKEGLKEVFYKLIDGGYDTFLVGMALGFDTLCFNLLEQIRKEKSIKIIACIPCESQAERFTKSQAEEYYRMLSVADEKVYVNKEYTKKCMQKRNEYMVNNCSVLVAYLKNDFGGTFNTVKFAKKIEIPIINVGEIL